jgi:hypothetical protein
MEAAVGAEIPVALGSDVKVFERIATINMSDPIMNAPPIRDHLRPILSTRNSTKNPHATTLTTPKNPVIRRVSFSLVPTAPKICGASSYSQ